MRSLLLTVTLGASLWVAAAPADQSLADISRATEAARNASASRPAAKVYTNKDLPTIDPAAPPVPVPLSTNSTTPAPSAPSTPAAATLPAAAKDEAHWRERMRPLRERLDSTRALADNTRRRAEELMRAADRCFRVGVVCEDYNQSLRLTEEHKMLVADVARAERDVAALEEEARRAGVPPGWVRH